MAGESPDKSEQLKSSGETTGTTGSERDPRLGVIRKPAAPAEATVTTSPSAPESEDGAEAAAGREGDRATAVFRTVRPRDGEAKAEPAAKAAADGDGEGDSPAADSDADADADADVKAKPVNGAGAVKGDARLKAAVAAWVASADEDGDADEAPSTDDEPKVADAKAADAGGKKPAARTPGQPAGEATDQTAGQTDDEPEKPAADQATAVFKTVRPKADDADASGDTSARKPDETDRKPAAAEKPAADQPTAVFKTMRPKADDAADETGAKDSGAAKSAGDRPTAAFGTVRPKDKSEDKSKDEPKGESKDQPKAESKPEPKAGGDQPTAVFGAVRPKEAKAEPKAGAKPEPKAGAKPEPKADAGDQPTELLKAPAPAPAPKAGAGQERKSQFVPLKDDAPAKAAPAKPGDKPAAAPAKPGIPVSVTPPKAPAAPAEAERTKQTPFPGRPAGAAPAAEAGRPAAPLDLLAQLTNTPPPPETPVRTAMRRVKIWTPLVLLLGIIFVVVQSFRPLPDPKLALGAKKAFTFEGGQPNFAWPAEGQSAAKVLGAGDVGTSGAQKPVPTASVAKVMTAYVILKDHPLKKGEKGADLVIDAQAAKESQSKDESRLSVTEGQTFSQYDMLQMLLIPSGNNIARQLARWDAKSEDEFVRKMNAVAKDLGMTNTTYTDPSGLKETTKSTASDQVKLAEVVIKNDVLREIVGKPNAKIPGLAEPIYNNNDKLLTKGTGVLGVKTGSSGPAGGSLMWAAKRTIDGKERLIVGATMDQHFKGGPDINAENSLKMVLDNSYKQTRAIQEALVSALVVKKGDVVGSVDDGLGGKTPVVATKDVKAVGWAGFATKFTLSAGGHKIPHTAKAGTEVGELTVGTGVDAVKVPVALKTALAEPSFGAKLGRLG
ncbi:D-alanyl-D-alanine carboxypeptidase [Streptomyces sp. NPDC053079]|uniref:D-alanyl-D-alanine carboxypeptidase n=1 Tax=Streptomyces sp. NPDC053079 TaxID=3365697 RepID=UPI0037D348FB